MYTGLNCSVQSCSLGAVYLAWHQPLHENISTNLHCCVKAIQPGRKLRVTFFFFPQPSYVLLLWLLRQSLPSLKESGPPAVLLTNMAKKSRSTQAVSIFYESSWVLPRGCPCHSHLKQDRKHTLHTFRFSFIGLI